MHKSYIYNAEIELEAFYVALFAS